VKHLKNIAHNAQDMVGKANTKPKELGSIAQIMVKNYNTLTENTKLAIKCTAQPEVFIKSAQLVIGLCFRRRQTFDFDFTSIRVFF